MKKRVLAMTLASVMLLMSGCGKDVLPDRESSSGSIEKDSSPVSNIEEDSSPVSNIEEDINYTGHQDLKSTGYQINNTTWENELVVYTGDYLEEDFQIITSPTGEEFTLFVYIDGILTPYYSSEDKEEKDYQLFKTTNDKLMKDISIYFKPVAGKKGETYNLDIVLINNPEYMLKDTSWLNFSPFLMSTEICTKHLKYEYEDKMADISDNYDVYDIDERMEEQFKNAEGKCVLDEEESLWFTYCTEPFSYENITSPTFDYFSVDKNSTLDFYIPILGNDSEYVFSVYINNEIVPAFDGKEYLDVKIQRDKYIEKKVSIPVDKYSGLNKIYVVAVSKGNNLVNKGWTALLEVK